MPTRTLKIHHWHDLSYREAWERQTQFQKELIAAKRAAGGEENSAPHHLVLCEHSPVITLGKSGKKKNLKLSDAHLKKAGVEYHEVNRGGDITYHGPGQLVAYPILDLDDVCRDVHKYVRSLEEIIIGLTRHYEIEAERLDGFTGVWLKPQNAGGAWRKLCAIGVHLSRWVSMHGLALNVNTDLSFFDMIVPCGIGESDKKVTSIANELGREVEMSEVKQQFINSFCSEFGFDGSTVNG